MSDIHVVRSFLLHGMRIGQKNCHYDYKFRIDVKLVPTKPSIPQCRHNLTFLRRLMQHRPTDLLF